MTILVTAPTKFNKNVVEQASGINPDVCYEVNNKREGVKVEKEIYNLLTLLDSKEVFLAPSKKKGTKEYLSYLDTTLKVDILVKIENHYLGWQIKASLKGAEEYLKNTSKVSFQGKGYPAPGVIAIDSWQKEKGWKVSLLGEISEISGVQIRKEVLEAFTKWKKLKKAGMKKIPSSCFSSKEASDLTILGLILVKGGETLLN